MLTSHAEEVLARLWAAQAGAADAMGEAAVQLIRAQMLGGYPDPVRSTGALLADVQWRRAGEGEVQVGNTLPYASAVHGGTAHMPARPYLTDALEQGRAQLMDAAASELCKAL